MALLLGHFILNEQIYYPSERARLWRRRVLTPYAFPKLHFWLGIRLSVCFYQDGVYNPQICLPASDENDVISDWKQLAQSHQLR